MDLDKSENFGVALPILSYGNNYLAELAALTLAVKAIPNDRKVTIFSDSLSSIASVKKGPLSERELTRIPCRGWLKTLRADLASKPEISIEYVRAHTGGVDNISKGNERADYLAKRARHLPLDSTEPSTFEPYGVYITYKGRLLLGGVKSDIKFVLNESRFHTWKSLRRQGVTLKKYRTSICKFQKTVRNFAIETGKERVWSYFILASLRWFTPLKRDGGYPPCDLCSNNAQNDLLHFLSCPSLLAEHESCYSSILDFLTDKGFSIPAEVLQKRDSHHLDFLSKVALDLRVTTSKDPKIGMWKDCILNLKNCDMFAAIAGFLPPAFLKVLKTSQSPITVSEIDEMKIVHHK